MDRFEAMYYRSVMDQFHSGKVSEYDQYDQEIPQSHTTADQPTASLGRAKNANSRKTVTRHLEDNQSKATGLLSPSR